MSGAGRLRLALAVLIVGATAVVGAPGSGAATPGVTVSDTDFSPSSIKVRVDEPVVFTITQDAQYSHTITSDDGSFKEQKVDWNHPKVTLPLSKPGRYAYYCRYDGSKGGGGMSGVILVAADQVTTTTQPPTTSTTATTVASTTTTTEPAPIQAFEAPPPDPPAAAPEPATTTTKAPKPAPTTTTTKVKAAAAATSATDLPTTTTIGGPALPSLSSLLAPDAPPAAGAPDTTPSTAGGETAGLALRLPDGGEGQPADGTGLLIAVGVVLIAVVAAGAGYAWHHRPSRYFAA